MKPRALLLALLLPVTLAAPVRAEEGVDEVRETAGGDTETTESETAGGETETTESETPTSEAETPANEAAYSLSPDPPLNAHVRELLRSGDYDFCTRENYRFFKKEKVELCSASGELMEACPGLRGACSRPAWEEEPEPAEVQEEPGWFAQLWSSLIQAIPILGHAVFWIVLIVLVAMILLYLIRRPRKRRERAETTAAPEAQSEPEVALEFDRRNSRQLLAAAAEQLNAGQTRAAVHLFYRATVVSLAEAHLVVAHHGKTRLDYLDELEGPLHPEVSELTFDLELARYQPATPDAALATRLAERVAELSRRLGQALPLALLWLCASCTPEAFPEAANEPTGPRGHQLLGQLLEENADAVSRRLRELNTIDENVDVIVLLGARLRPIEWRVLAAWVERGGHLVMSGSDPEFASNFALSGDTVACDGTPETKGIHLVAVGPQLGIANERGFRLASCGERALATNFERGSGYVTWVPNESWFQNSSLALGDNATWMLDLIEPEESTIEMLGSWTGQGAHHPLESLTRAGLGPWALQLMILLALYAWATGRRFGSPRDVIEERRRSFREHAEALSAQYQRAQASGFALSRYAEWAFEVLRRRVASSEDNARSLGRALGPAGEKESELTRNLTLARKADELGENELRHVSRFRALDEAVRKHGR